ncbi:hypothetical protein HaLaN_21108 [Haematococcus lacustris]|uniref:Uncharacterized protein n=1 Tax=Haematococcus lacustris TaxID=44745 RepID=A0A699ZMV6_HAELA|nr:hypothetical protein HaLaN_21108 [Haematococcus lacustris]
MAAASCQAQAIKRQRSATPPPQAAKAAATAGPSARSVTPPPLIKSQPAVKTEGVSSGKAAGVPGKPGGAAVVKVEGAAPGAAPGVKQEPGLGVPSLEEVHAALRAAGGSMPLNSMRALFQRRCTSVPNGLNLFKSLITSSCRVSKAADGGLMLSLPGQ